MSRLRVPHAPGAGINLFTGESWWEAVATGTGAIRDETVTLLDLPGAPWEGEQTLLVAAPVTDVLAEPSVPAVAAWADAVHTVAAAQPGTIRVAVSTGSVRSLPELITLAQGRRWPAFDLGEAARHRAQDALPVGLSAGGQGVVARFAEALVGNVAVLTAGAWQTAADGMADATACLGRALDADPDLTDAEARALRDACRAALASFEESGLVLSGPRDALLWPVPPDHGRIPLDVVADAAVEVLLAQAERPADPDLEGTR